MCSVCLCVPESKQATSHLGQGAQVLGGASSEEMENKNTGKFIADPKAATHFRCRATVVLQMSRAWTHKSIPSLCFSAHALRTI